MSPGEATSLPVPSGETEKHTQALFSGRLGPHPLRSGAENPASFTVRCRVSAPRCLCLGRAREGEGCPCWRLLWRGVPRVPPACGRRSWNPGLLARLAPRWSPGGDAAGPVLLRVRCLVNASAAARSLRRCLSLHPLRSVERGRSLAPLRPEVRALPGGLAASTFPKVTHSAPRRRWTPAWRRVRHRVAPSGPLVLGEGWCAAGARTHVAAAASRDGARASRTPSLPRSNDFQSQPPKAPSI